MSSFVLKLKSKSGQTVVSGLTGESTLLELKEKLSSITKIKPEFLHVLYGYPPKPLALGENTLTLDNCAISSGEILIVEEKEVPCSFINTGSETQESKADASCDAEAANRAGTESSSSGILLRKVVPADNSCLFTSIGYVLSGKVHTDNGAFLREIIAESVAANPDEYSEAILGKPNPEYCQWIKKPESWGGAIELAVLSHFYGIEIDVVDTLNCIINRFGEDQNYGQRVLLIFDGIHYDPLYLEPFQGGKLQTIFPISDDNILTQALALSEEAKSSRQFTDLARFTLKCMVCHVMLTGQVQAQRHAKETGHRTFGEVAS
ncbi:ubiquitin thioesterase OTU1 [Ischnura elegans]|uniref:ubiquitin thioesterase OTU1 n=1 Tax=Ischnura elegans TaxID=197161 RepID=UPI001ED87075|nr:ubiquitin thioesterase OTU1 [Ischnura elegans]